MSDPFYDVCEECDRHDFTAVYNDDAYPTGKPVELYRQLLQSPVLEEGETLIEPFCGSGPGAEVAHQRGCGYWGADTNPEAVARSRRRFEQTRLPGQTTLADGGQSSE